MIEAFSGTDRNFVQLFISNYYGVKSAEERLNKYKITAPFDGVISTSFVENGTMARAGLILGEFINSDSFEIETIKMWQLSKMFSRW